MHFAISKYGEYMATKKVTITLDETLVEALLEAAREDGVPLSRVVSQATEHTLRLRKGLAVVREWEAEQGALTAQELADARAELAAADAAHLAAVRGGPE